MTEQGPRELTPQEKLLTAIFGRDIEKTPEIYPSANEVNQFMEETGLSEGGNLNPPSFKEQVEEVLNSLTARERYVLTERFGLGDDGRSKTLKEIAIEHGMQLRGKPYTPERIHQIEVKALRKLRHPSRSAKLHDYLA